MEILLLLLLMVSAAALYLPEILKERALDSPVDTVSEFRRGMTAIAVSTHNYQPGMYSYSPRGGGGEPEPYVRRNHYRETEFESDSGDDFIPYPSNRAKAEMETRRQRIMVILWIIALGTGILTLLSSLEWMIPVHIAILVLLAGYTMLAVVLPHYNKRYR